MEIPPRYQDDNLKEKAIRQIIELGCSIEDVAKQTGVCEMTLYQWTQEYMRKVSNKQDF